MILARSIYSAFQRFSSLKPLKVNNSRIQILTVSALANQIPEDSDGFVRSLMLRISTVTEKAMAK
jgi:hypothetical protein